MMLAFTVIGVSYSAKIVERLLFRLTQAIVSLPGRVIWKKKFLYFTFTQQKIGKKKEKGMESVSATVPIVASEAEANPNTQPLSLFLAIRSGRETG